MDQLEMFPPVGFACTAALQIDGTWSLTLSVNDGRSSLHPWRTERYEKLSLNELFDVVLMTVY